MTQHRYGLPYYIRTLEIRHRLIGFKHSDCGKIFFSSKIHNFCPDCGRGGEITKVSLIKEGIIDSISINRVTPNDEKWIGNKAVGLVEIDIDGTKVKVPTEFTDIEIPNKSSFNVMEWISQRVEPTARILEFNPSGALYYGIKFRPIPKDKKRQKPFLEKLVESEKPGISSIGICLPRYRTTAEEMARQFHIDPNYIIKGLGVKEVSVPSWDQDSGTFAVDAAFDAVSRLPKEFIDTIGMVVVGSESKPYSVKPIATAVQSFLGIKKDIICYDAEFACIAAGMQIKNAIALIKTGEIESALIIGSDVSQGAPGDPLDLDTGAGGICLVISKYNVILEYMGMNFQVGDHPDFARRKNQIYPFHGYALTGNPSYFAFQGAAVKKVLKNLNLSLDQIKAATFHQPNYNFIRKEIKIFGLDDETRIKKGLKPCIIGKPVINIGNTYSAATMFGLASIINEPYHEFEIEEELARKLEFDDPKNPKLKLNEGDLILTGWYGSGAAGGCSIFKVTNNFEKYIEVTIPFKERMINSEGIGGNRYVSMLTRYFAKGMIKKY
ncbi:MAG: hypothetical protein ACTSVY_14435 [Candidatus Helarchaeota archaeon]